MYVPSVKVASVYLSQLPALFFLNQSPLPESIQKYAGAPVVTVTVGFLYAPPYTSIVERSDVPSTLFTFVRSAGEGLVTVYSGEVTSIYEKVSPTRGVLVVHAAPSTVTVTPALSSTCVKPAASSMRT